MDDYLLGKKLGGYFESFEYASLNVPERILLARRQQGRIDGIRMDLRDRISLIPPDLGRETALFEGALASFGMSGERKAGIDKAKKKAMANKLGDMKPMAEAAPSAFVLEPPALSLHLWREDRGPTIVTSPIGDYGPRHRFHPEPAEPV